MNVYDFDGTIYNGDSTVDFFLYALRQKPALIRYLPKQLWGFALYGAKKINKTQMKELFFSFLSGIDAQKLQEGFWNHHRGKIFDWYLRQQEAGDIIISASPEFLLRPICQRLGIQHLIASEVDAATGKFNGTNCRGREKVRRLAEEYHVSRIDRFYSDSESDLPLAKIAEQPFLVKKGVPQEWMIL